MVKSDADVPDFTSHPILFAVRLIEDSAWDAHVSSGAVVHAVPVHFFSALLVVSYHKYPVLAALSSAVQLVDGSELLYVGIWA